MFDAEVQELIAYLQEVKKAPCLYLGPVTDESLQAHLHGIFIACHIFGFERNGEIYVQVESERGWDSNTSFGSLPSMKKAGLSETEIVDETLSIEIEALERMLAQSTS